MIEAGLQTGQSWMLPQQSNSQTKGVQ